jgi:hypothetical protein
MLVGQILPQLWVIQNPKRKEEPVRLLFRSSHELLQILHPSVKRYAQTKRFLARRSLSTLQFLRNLPRASLFPSECL